MDTIKISVLNEVLSNNKHKYFLNEQKGHTGVADGSDGEQGEYNETFKYYRHPEMPESVFLQVTYHSDSYGDNDSVNEMKFVQGVTKQVTVYEPIK